ncbi:hypothetical protein Taiwan43_01720 [Helicobacter pylori]
MNIKGNEHSKIDEILVKGVGMRKDGLGGASTQTGNKEEKYGFSESFKSERLLGVKKDL